MIDISDSNIHGNGVFAVDNIPDGVLIGVWCTKTLQPKGRMLFCEGMSERWYETEILGRYCNHSATPNTRILLDENSISLLSNGIDSNEEILVDYKWVEQVAGYKVDVSGF